MPATTMVCLPALLDLQSLLLMRNAWSCCRAPPMLWLGCSLSAAPISRTLP